MLKTWRNNFEWGGRRGVTILSHRPVTSNDLKQDRLFFREIVSTFLQLVVATGKAYITEGNHRLWMAIQEGIPFIPCRVIPHWLPPNGSYKKLEIDFSTLKFGETILPEQLGLTVAQIGFNK